MNSTAKEALKKASKSKLTSKSQLAPDKKAGAAAASSKTTPSYTASGTQDVLRLSKTIKPQAYQITVEPDLEKFTYTGEENIALTISAESKEIILNALELTVSSAELESSDDAVKKQSAKIELDPKNEQLHLKFDDTLAPGKYKLQIKFAGILNDQLRGFYRSYYKDNAGEKHWLCSTQFEPADARRMYPCFDEPEFKATFQINAVIDSKLTAISNAPINHVVENKDRTKKTVAFEASPKMSTYLMVLVVGDFKSTEERKSCDVPIRVWAPAGQENMGKYSLDAACEIMTFLSDYFGIKFPAKKLDLIAIPDFAPGAMENLGAITFKDSLLLIDEKTGSNFARRSALSVIAHEMAHQWFGDLVTNRWWDDLWLNEAFATWAATKTENALRPDWRIRSKAVLERDGAMNIDELASTRAIHAHVGNPKQASEMFDAITYDKGSAVLRMLEVFVGEKSFQKGVHDYLEAHKFDNATSEDLWQSIGAASKDVPVSKMMQTWIMQAGFPLLTADSKNAGKTLSLSQSRFFVMPDAKPDSTQWIVPVLARGLGHAISSKDEIDALHSDSRTALLLDKTQADFNLASAWDPIVVNAGASGFYRVLYSQDELKKILEKFHALSADERLALMSDIGTLSWKGSMPVEDNLNLMLKIKGEEDSIVLSALAAKFAGPRYFMDNKSKPEYQKFVQVHLLPLKKKLGWEEKKGEEETLKDLRAELMKELGTFGRDKATITEARELYAKYLKDRHSVSADIIGSVLKIVAYNSAETEYDQIKEAWKKASNPQEEKRFLNALADFHQPELVDKTLNLALGTETRATDGVALLSAMLADKEVNEQAWKFTKANWDQFAKKFPPRFNKRIIAACSSFNTPEAEQDLRSFFAAHPLEMGKAAIARTLEDVHVSVLYKQRNEQHIRDWVIRQAEGLKD